MGLLTATLFKMQQHLQLTYNIVVAMEEIIYITGHKNPDTDSICSAITYADRTTTFKHCCNTE